MTIEYTDEITQGLLDEFDKLLVEQYDIKPDETYTSETELLDNSWPTIVKLGGSSASLIIEIINTLSLRYYEESLIDTDLECDIGTPECYEQWLESNLPYYDEGDDFEADSYNHEEAINSARSLSRMITVENIY
jgi:hypothetical protein